MWPFPRSIHRYVPLSSSASKLRLRAPPTLQLFLTFLALYTIAVLFQRHRSRRDPTSAFFDLARGYEARYSLVRRRQADRFIDAVEQRPADFRARNAGRERERSLCVAIP